MLLLTGFQGRVPREPEGVAGNGHQQRLSAEWLPCQEGPVWVTVTALTSVPWPRRTNLKQLRNRDSCFLFSLGNGTDFKLCLCGWAWFKNSPLYCTVQLHRFKELGVSTEFWKGPTDLDSQWGPVNTNRSPNSSSKPQMWIASPLYCPPAPTTSVSGSVWKMFLISSWPSSLPVWVRLCSSWLLSSQSPFFLVPSSLCLGERESYDSSV